MNISEAKEEILKLYLKSLKIETPSTKQILELLELWLNSKAYILSGEDYQPQ